MIFIFAVVAISITAMVILFSGANVSPEGISVEKESVTSREYATSGFTKVSAGGLWVVEIVKGEITAIYVYAPSSLLGLVKPEVSNGTLHLSMVPGTNPRDRNCTARITMPELSGISCSGNARVSFSGFTTDELVLKVTDAGQATGADSRIGRLDCTAEVSAIADLSACVTKDAGYNASMASKVILRLEGGSVKGEMSGSAAFTYSGEPDRMDIATSGSARITKKSAL